MPHAAVLVREPGRLTRAEAERALRLDGRAHLAIWENVEAGSERDAAFYAAILALGRVDDQESVVV